MGDNDHLEYDSLNTPILVESGLELIHAAKFVEYWLGAISDVNRNMAPNCYLGGTF